MPLRNNVDLPPDERLPVYTILVPLYQEVHKLKSIVGAMAALDYPSDKLDVKIIVEEDDNTTLRALQLIHVPPFMQVIKVPFSLPRTKPKAMNYAASFARGEYLTIYDAEDKPDPQQLRKALHSFSNLSREYVCLQAKLNFYNGNENLLTKFFSIEYGIWFNYLLKGLSSYAMPIPLGGTSNHFKFHVLKEVGFWDAYNVTEDADLGIRLTMRGYKVHLLDSTTLEESPVTLRNWFHQRARWIKGYIQTSLVYWKNTVERSRLSKRQKLGINLFVCLIPYSFFSMPWIFLGAICSVNNAVFVTVIINAILSIIYIYSSATIYYINHRVGIKAFGWKEFVLILVWPSYFIILSIASYIAFWQCMTNPFKWNKTIHGESKELPDI